ncbi:unnamed protein product [Paramecium primaurelia]|uniref:Alpha/beta hydrolase fold-3 domain-containing protein n=1 Tax=Paramecium primaurelia TaxID=5886 RepID=A0A8S1JNQ4_PARPR|nr:unnamed protein product [Paramecium primaurelia]
MQFIQYDSLFNYSLEQNEEMEFVHPEHHLNIQSRIVKDKFQQNLQNSIIMFNQILGFSQNIINKYNNYQDSCTKALQLIGISSDGLMQIEQIYSLIEQKEFGFNSKHQNYNIAQTYNQINQYTTNLVLDYLNNFILNKIQELLNKFPYQDKQQNRKFSIYCSKLQSCIEILPGAIAVKQDDLFSVNQQHIFWQQLKNYIEQKQLADHEQIRQSYDKVCEGILLANAMISKGSEYEGEIKQKFMQGFGFLIYALNKQKMKSRANHFLADPKKEDVFKAWNLPEQGLIKILLPAIFPQIQFNKKIYIPRYFRCISSEYILNQYKRSTINKINNDCGLFYPENKLTLDDLLSKNLDRVQVRILCHEILKQKKQSLFQQFVGQLTKNDTVFDKIVIHIHGGGFVAMSSRSHQTYTRKWANALKVPIFSIDYRMAPNNPYPAGLDDCWQAYMFILTFIEQYYNIVPNKIVLVGDSAGGNLVAALTIQAIKAGVRIPDGILLAYPALSLDIKQFTPSFLVSLDDSLLHHTVLKLCLQSYIEKEFNPNLDPMLSPSKASDDILKRFPKTRIQVGTYDPLHDESFRFLQRLIQLKRDARLIEYQSMPHGFLSFDVINGMNEAKQTVLDAQNILFDLLK